MGAYSLTVAIVSSQLFLVPYSQLILVLLLVDNLPVLGLFLHVTA